MNIPTYYSTITESIDALRKEGFTIDFNLDENCLICGDDKYDIDDLEIVKVYRYEGLSDPSDENVVYGIASKDDSIKGILVAGYSSYVDEGRVRTIQKLKFRNRPNADV